MAPDTALPSRSLRVGLYIRYSSEEQRERSFSEETQYDQCVQKLRQVHGEGPHSIRIFKDLAQSGAIGPCDPAFPGKEHRQGLTQLLEAIGDGEVDVLLCYSQDRLARDEFLWHFMNATIFQRNQVTVLFSRDGHDISTEEGQMLASMHAMSAALERRKISRNLKAACQRRAEEGYHHSTAPFGWERDPTQVPTPRERTRLVRNDAEGAIVVEIKDRFLAGWPTVAIARDLNQRGVPSRSGEPRWQTGTVRMTLLSPLHAGLVAHRGALHPGEHAALRYWSPEEREYLCRRIHEHTHRRRDERNVVNYLLSGLLYCGHCGRRLTGCRSVDHGTRYYRCTSPRSGGKHRRSVNHTFVGERSCPGMSRDADVVEAAVVAAVAGLANSASVQVAADQKLSQALDLTDGRLRSELKAVEAEMAKATKGFSLLFGMLSEGRISQEEFETENGLRRGKEEALVARQRTASASLAARVDRRAELERALGLLRDFDVLWDQMTPGERKHLISQVDDHMVIEREGDELTLTISPGFVPPIEVRFPVRSRTPAERRTPVDRLTPRQLSLLCLWRDGNGIADIAQLWCVTDMAVRTTARMARLVLGVSGLGEAVELASERIARCLGSLPLHGRCNKPNGTGQARLSGVLTDVWRLMAQGKGCLEIAAALAKDKSTISRQMQQVCKRLQVSTPAEAVARGRDLGLE